MTAHERYYVGGGSIASIAGIGLSTPLQEYHKIIGDAPELSAEDRKFFARRRRVEDYVIPILEEEHGIRILKRNERYTDAEFDFMRAEIDAESEDGRNGEVKSIHYRATQPWGRSEDGDAGVPEYVLAQVIWGLGIRRPPQLRAFAVGQIAFDETRLYDIDHDPDTFQMLRTIGHRFWHENVLKRVAPAPITASDAYLAWPKSTWRKALAPADVIDTLKRMAHCREERNKLKAEIERGQFIVQQAMTDADILVDAAGKKLVTWRSQPSQVEVDYEGYVAELEQRLRSMSMFPDEVDKLRAQFSKNKPGSRPFYNLVSPE